MATTAPAPSRPETLADLLERLGNIPPERIRTHPAPGTATEADLLACPDKPPCELIDGVLVEKAVGYYESTLAMILGHLLFNFLDEHDLGILSGEAGLLRLSPGLVRGPDIAFVSWDRLPNRTIPREPFLDLAPDLVVEVMSKSNTEAEMKRKRRECFAVGTRLFWQVYPKSRTVRVYTSPTEMRVLNEDDRLDGGDVLPGFQLVLRDWFDRAGQRAAR
jgi:Uma2 family endonuclease